MMGRSLMKRDDFAQVNLRWPRGATPEVGRGATLEVEVGAGG